MKKVAFTIVLNGMPFIKQQYEIIPKIFDEWYIIEGVAAPVKDTSWCKEIPDEFHKLGLSIDGTTEFLESIKSKQIKVYHAPSMFWQGKTEMCNVFMPMVQNSILMQFDVDEIWDYSVLKSILTYAELHHSEFDSITVNSNFYVGPNIVVKGENCWGSSNYWNRLWIIRERTEFISHEPVILKGGFRNKNKQFSIKNGWTHNHYAYVYEHQLRFKEVYYGYTDAVNQWKKLQQVQKEEFPVKLNEYFDWVKDDAMAVWRD